VAELLLHGRLAREQTAGGAIEARARQLVDGILEGHELMKHADRLTRGGGRFLGHTSLP
jgi:hypothetical protein